MAFQTLLACVLLVFIPVIRADPDAVQDYCVADVASSPSKINGLPCLDPKDVRVEHFITKVLGVEGNTSASPSGLAATLITPQSLPGINSLELTMVRFDLAPGGIITPHTHPRGTEMVYVQKGELNAGFLDTSNRLFFTKIQTGDTFLIPKAAIHFLENTGKEPAVLIGSFNTQNPGTALISLGLFASTPAIPDSLLSKAFQIDESQVQEIKKKFGG